MGKTKENAYKEDIKSKARRQEKKPNNPCLAVDVSADGCWGEGGELGVCMDHIPIKTTNSKCRLFLKIVQ
jgi:hypothetical protein